MSEVRKRWGDEETVVEKIRKHRLEWLGHLAHMLCQRTPKAVCLVVSPSHAPGAVQGEDGRM